MCMQDNYGIKAKPNTSHNHHNTSKCNHWASTQCCQWHAQIIWLGKQWKSRRTRRFSIWLLPSINCMVTRLLEALIIQHWMQHHANLCLVEIWSTILPSERIGMDFINKSDQKENKSQIPHEYKVGDQVLLETPGILRKLSTPHTGPYPVMNLYRNCTIRIQKGKKEWYQKEWISVESLHSIKSPIKYYLGGEWHTIEYDLNIWIVLHPCLTCKIKV
jgi:hypothetical protein